jgi:D-alanyl-lipoteichoic acid acyltransferase DltB (MBOAT superfamily)
MTIVSLYFLVFVLAVSLVYNLLPSLQWRRGVQLVANLAFLSTFSHTPAQWIPYLVFLSIGYASYLVIRRKRKRALTISLCLILLLFFILKQYSFLPSILFLRRAYVSLGMSYVLFRILHLLIDTRQGVIAQFVGPVDYLNYALNFTSIVSGPIQRFEDFADSQLRPDRPRLDLIELGLALERIVIGFFKVTVAASIFDNLHGHALDRLSAAAGQSQLSQTLTASMLGVCYPIFLYFNFSGYTDIVIGAARGIRLTLPENFNRPFSSPNFLEFWNRWHMTLSGWLKTYVNSPLLKYLMERFPNSAIDPYLGVVSICVTFFLIGVWHGRTAMFVVYGVLLGLGVSVNKLYQIQIARSIGRQRYRTLCGRAWYKAMARGLTFTYFAFSLVWFWATGPQLAVVVRALGARALLLGCLLIWLAATLLLSLYEAAREAFLSVRVGGTPLILSRYTRVAWCSALVLVLSVYLSLMNSPTPEIVYRAF